MNGLWSEKVKVIQGQTMSLTIHRASTWLSWRSRLPEVGVSDCDVITRSGGSVRYDVTWWFRGFPAGIPSAAVITSVGVVSAETSGNDAVTMETQRMHQMLLVYCNLFNVEELQKNCIVNHKNGCYENTNGGLDNSPNTRITCCGSANFYY